MQLFLEAVPIIFKLFSKTRGHLLFSNYSQNNLPKPNPRVHSLHLILSESPSPLPPSLSLYSHPQAGYPRTEFTLPT